MADLLDHRLIVVTGKGGVGKTTVTAALGALAARSGRRTILVEVGDHRQLPRLLGHRAAAAAGVEVAVAPRLWTLTVDPDQALVDWLSAAAGRIPARFLTSRTAFQYFAAAAPGAEELLSMVKVSELTRQTRRGGSRGYDLVILDAPATGHALAMLSSPQTFTAIVRAGRLATLAQRVRELLADEQRSAYLAVSQGTELAVSETLDLASGLRSRLGRELAAVIVNGTIRRRFSAAELERIGRMDGALPAVRSAVSAACSINERARRQQQQVARLRRARLPVVAVPFRFERQLDRDSVEQIADQLQRASL